MQEATLINNDDRKAVADINDKKEEVLLKRKFFILWLGQMLSIIGSGLTGFALGVWVYNQTGQVTYYALTVMSTAVPSILIRPIGGALADRFSRRKLMLIADFGSGFGILFIAIMLWSGNIRLWHIYAGMCFSSVFVGLGLPAYQSAISQLIPKSFYAQANGMIQAAASANFLISPFLAGILLPVINIQGILITDFFTFFIAVTATFLIKVPLTVSKGAKKGIGLFFKEIGEAVMYLVNKKSLFALILILAAVNFFMGFIITLIGPMVLAFTTPTVLGMGQSASAIGMLLSSILILFLKEPKKLVRSISIYLFIMGISYSLVGIRANYFTIIISCFGFFITLPFINSYTDVIIRRQVEQSIQGRVYAFIGLISQPGLIIAYAISGFLADKVFEPLLARDGVLAGSVGQIIGVGPGRGIAFLFIVMGIFISITALVTSRLKGLKQLEINN